jgi:hypothetical protein
VLYFVSAELSLCYLLFAFLSAVGALQVVAARYRLDGLAFLDYLEHPMRGYLLGSGLTLVGTLAFFISQWAMIFAPGPAGAELTLLFGAAALLAVLATLLLSSILQPRRDRRDQAAVPSSSPGQAQTVGPARGRLFLPENPAAPLPAVCLLPSFPPLGLEAMAQHLVQQGLVVLLIEPDSGSYSYPAVLAVLPAAIALLSRLPYVDPQRLGVLGYDVGGDLAIRAASVDRLVKAVVTIAPVLVQVPPGLQLLREMSYPRALRWARDRRRETLRSELTALEYGAKIAPPNGTRTAPRPFLIMYGAEDALVNRAPMEGWGAEQMTIPGAGHVHISKHRLTLEAAAQWFKEHL